MSKNSKIAKESVQNIIDGLEKKLKNFKMDLANKSEKLEKKVVDGTWKPAKIAKKKAELKEIEAKINETAEKIAKYEATLKEGTSEEVLDKEKTTYGKFIIENTEPAEDDIEVEAEEIHDEPDEAKVEDTKALTKDTDGGKAKAELAKKIAARHKQYKPFLGADFGNPKRGKIIVEYYKAFIDAAEFAMVNAEKYVKALLAYDTRVIEKLDTVNFDHQIEYTVIIDGVVDDVYEEFMKKMTRLIAADRAVMYDFMMHNMMICLVFMNDKVKLANATRAYMGDALVPTKVSVLCTPYPHEELSNGAWVDSNRQPMTGVKEKGGSDKDVANTKEYASWLERNECAKADVA